LSGKTYNLSMKLPKKPNAVPFVATLTVDKFLASSNDEVYKGTMTQNGAETEVVLKVMSLYPFTKSHSGKFSMARVNVHEVFYDTPIYDFVIPGAGAVGTIFPYLGRTVSDIPVAERVPLYNVFKKWLVNKYISMTKKQWGSPLMRTAYNDYKPANVTLDSNGDFHLIDYDEHSYTPMFYGPTNEKTFVNQMFGVLLVIYWFKTDDTPFKVDASGAYKIKWVNTVLTDKELSVWFNILLDDDLSVDQKIELFKN
jgi:hypothetical protein